MNSIKRYLSIIIPLVGLLFSLESLMVLNRVIKDHESKLIASYSIIIATKTATSLQDLNIKEISSLQEINTNQIIEEIKEGISSTDIEILKSQLPVFYSIKLHSFPTQNTLKKITNTLLSQQNVIKVESFTKTHSQVYKLLILIKNTTTIFAVLISILSVLLIIKQIEVWYLQHSERMEIMNYLGAPRWIKNGILFKLAFMGALISSVLTIFITYYIYTTPIIEDIIKSLEISKNIFSLGNDFFILLGSSMVFSVFSVFIVILRQKDK